MLRELPRL
jgi:hypothetical protein